jgi:F-type H+-transporting ATPase subunit gamma
MWRPRLASVNQSARELKSVVRTMKGLAAASIVQYERAVLSLANYYSVIRSRIR